MRMSHVVVGVCVVGVGVVEVVVVEVVATANSFISDTYFNMPSFHQSCKYRPGNNSSFAYPAVLAVMFNVSMTSASPTSGPFDSTLPMGEMIQL